MGNLLLDGYTGRLYPTTVGGPIVFNGLPVEYTHSITPVCSIAGGTLSCQVGDGINILQVCADNYLYLTSVVQDGCYVPTLKVVAVC